MKNSELLIILNWIKERFPKEYDKHNQRLLQEKDYNYSEINLPRFKLGMGQSHSKFDLENGFISYYFVYIEDNNKNEFDCKDTADVAISLMENFMKLSDKEWEEKCINENN